MADAERAQVYAAELAAFDGTDLERVADVHDVLELIRNTVAGEWWPGGPVEASAARSDAQSSTTRCNLHEGAVPHIRIARPQATVATATHELAHALAGVAHGHGELFRRAHADIVQVATNRDRSSGRGMLHVDQLIDAYRAAGLVVGDRTWPSPPSVGGAIAL